LKDVFRKTTFDAMTEAETETRRITDPTTLRALAHPVRLRLLEVLTQHGPLTATEAAERVGDSPSNCSWHLRQLARHGFVTEAEKGGVGRRRPWRIVPVPYAWSGDEGSPEFVAVSRELSDLMLHRTLERLRAYRGRAHAEPPAWREAAETNDGLAWMTAGELAEFNATIRELVMRCLPRFTDPEQRPAGARLVHLFAYGHPAAREG
jgi:DNA-binding transcriptional ArsR family regulator